MAPLNISFIIVNWNTRVLLLKCLDSIIQTVKLLPFEIWVVDNGSMDGSAAAAKQQHPDIHLIENKSNRGFAAANNQALRQMTGQYAILLNSDAVLTEGAAHALFEFMENTPKAGMACGQLLNTDGSKQNSIANFPSLLGLLSNESLLQLLMPNRFPGKRRQVSNPIEIESGIGACLIVRKAAMDEAGLLDEEYFFFFEETDWARRMWAHGWKVYFVPEARIVHAQGKSVGPLADGRILFYRSRYIYLKKWHPKNGNLMRWIIFLRLLINLSLSGIGTGLTLGCIRPLRNKTVIYGKILKWHLRGCP
ncbi:MAG TPA: glycosyltransferase family 2 protein [Desulfatirhabdiaceae bacterium]|nr:glycosyltransferase family 2 protein [Desulfatirhabdiaceae bacterium]